MSQLSNILAVLGGAGLTIAALVAASYGLFRWLGKTWIESQFEKSLEHFRHEKLRELESLRADLNTKLNRSAILNEREFEVLPQAYRMLAEAHGEVARFTGPLQTYADVDRMSQAQLDELLERVDGRLAELLPPHEATAAMLNATVQTGGPDGAYTVQLMAEGVSGVADLRPFNVSADFIGQARHFTQGETRYEDVIDFNIKATATGARVTFFSLSLIGGALGDADWEMAGQSDDQRP